MDGAIVTISLDDGRRDSFDCARALLKRYEIPSTINIVTQYVREGRLDDTLPEPPMSVEQVRMMAEDPLFEVAAHGHAHRNDWEDIALGRSELLEWLGKPAETQIGFASPGSGMTGDFIRENRTRLRDCGFRYVRTGLRIQTRPKWRLLARKAARIVHSRHLFAAAYADTLQSDMRDMTVYAVPVLRDTRLQQLLYLVDRAIDRKQCCTLLFHSILPRGERAVCPAWCWEAERFEALLRVLDAKRKAGNVRLMTTMQAYETMTHGE